ncbi:MAG: TonB-dependent receptor domain-containing protein [Pyrinomonadaceae bacterium]
MKNNFTLRLFAVLAVALMSIGYAVGQSSTTGAITGRVTDPQDAVIAGATVKVTNLETKAEANTTTNSEGTYRVNNLDPGNYRIDVSATGFATGTSAKDIVVEVSRPTSVDVKLGLVGATAQVEVTGETPVINTVDPTNSTNVNQVSINNLPINGRRAASFALLTPGVNPDGGFGLLSFRGISGLMNNSTVDGGDDNQAFFSEQRGRTRINYSISADAVREFSVNTSNYSAEFGRSAGGVVNTITKSGTNEFHGDGFFYARSEKWAARNADAFATLANGTKVGLKPRDRRYQFGGSVGGPIVHDKVFFFFSYDQQKRDFPAISQPSSGDNFYATGTPGPITQNGVTFNLTQAQINSGVAYLKSITGIAPRRGDQRIILPKIDWKLNDKNTFTAVWNHMRWNSPAGVQTANIVSRSITSFGTDLVDLDTVNLRLNSTISSTMLNEGRFQWSRDFERQIAEKPFAGEPTTGPGGFAPGANIGSGANSIVIGKPNFLNRSAFPDEHRIQFADTVTWINGKHTYKFGGDFNHVSDVMGNLFQEGGIYSYTDFNHWLVDFNSAGTTKFYSSFSQGFGPTTFRFRTNDYAFFGQMDYQVDQNLTLNFGMRWEYEQMPKPQIPNPALPLTSQFPSDKNNFGPRVGFAYTFGKDFENVIRAGYGMFYGRITNSAISNAITNTGLPTGQIQTGSILPTAANAPFYPNVLASFSPASGGSAGDVITFANGFQNPLVHQMDVVYERRIGRNTVVSATGMISVGRFLPYFVDTNLRPPASTSTLTFVGGPFAGQSIIVPKYTGARPNTSFSRITEIRSSVSSEYYGLTLQANRRLTNGIQFQSSYTYSKATDNGQNSQTFTTGNSPLDPFNLDDERSTSSFDTPHHFVASLVYSPNMLFGVGHDSAVGRAIFGGWTIAPIVTGSSGFAYTATAGTGNISGGTSTGVLGAGGSNRIPNTKPNTFRTPHFWDVDLRISRRFNLGEKRNIEFLAEGFNIFNKQIVTGVGTRMYTLSGTTLTYDTTFGTTTNTSNFFYRERQIQLAARFSF